MLLLSMILSSGCWDSIDINDRNIVTAVVVDKTDYGYAFYAEIPDITGTGSESANQKKKPVIVKSEGRTYSEAREDLDRKMDKPVFLGAVQTVILTERLARYDIEEYMLRLRQLTDYRKTVHVVVTTEDPTTLLTGTTEHAESIGFAVDQTLSSLVDTGQLHLVSLMDVLQRLSSSYKQYILPTIDSIDQEPCYTGYSVFSGGMKTGFIPAAECKSIEYMQTNNAVALYTVPYGETRATMEVRLAKKKIVPRYVDNKAIFDVTLGFKATLQYPEQAKAVSDDEMAVLQATLQTMLEQEFAEMFRKSQTEYKFDCFRLWSPFRIAYPEEAKQINWSIDYQKASLNLSISVKLSPSGMVDYSEK